MTASDRQRWDEKYAARQIPTRLTPDAWLVQNISAVARGRALELACGLGHNAIWLAQIGWTVAAVDVSPVGLQLAQRLSECHKVQVTWIAADLDEFQPASMAYDLVCIFRYLDRQRVPRLVESALTPGGWLVYETFTESQLQREDNHLRNPDYMLAADELPKLFPGLTPVRYREVELDDRSVAQLVARRPIQNHAS